MTDNIIQFPIGELEIDVELENDEGLVDAAFASLLMQCNGLFVSTDLDYAMLFEASIQTAVECGLKSGMTPDEISEVFSVLRVVRAD